ncbi:reverse transcriptase domain-containing protein [Ohtaekwangia koreensis]|uniref:RNA-directed DNA polymerase n=1 Tax=Ohtaekwangia koreensis TaxID=688867 RepID=A0A1T5LA52_9BACT|nr:reverse transcriptase domain-containing protein [Ohtaekwangia koreensis]SKC72784.1 Reverse transcriptase (RNA-dependent DNA polymerase) [Ohtaekwangia koreensis]
MADNSQVTRQQLYDRIKASTRDSVILEEMKRLGFWKKDDGIPSLPEILITKESILTQELHVLLDQQRKYKNKEEALKEIRKARLEQSRLKREENKKLRKQKREAKAAQWKERKEKDIIYLGEDVSKGLNNKASDLTKLATYQLPEMHMADELANAMGITVGELRFLAYNRTVSKINHYKRFYIPKKTGGKRLISTPMPRLKKAQHWILENILNKVSIDDHAHGFVMKRSIVTNALPHVKAEVVINIDLKDFFPTISYQRVKGLYRSLGYSEQLSTIFGLISTESECDQIELDGEIYYAAGIDRFLPQGAPTSPAITNIICRKLDARLKGIASKLNFAYTRYADDLTFSASGENVNNTKTLLGFIKRIIKEENLTIHPDKFRVLRKGARKEVTGVIVNDKPAVNAKELDRFRALLFQIEKDGTLEGKHWKNSPNLLASIKGYASFVAMVDPIKGKPFVERTNKILETHGFKHIIKHKPKPPQTAAAVQTEEQAAQKKKPWWKFWA